MRDALQRGVLVLVLLLPGVAPGQVDLGLRAGYAVPRGTAANLGGLGSFDQRDLMGELIPIQVDAVWRFPHRLTAGVYLSYGYGSPGQQLRSLLCNANPCSRVTDMRFGAQGGWSAGPRGPVEPWVGAGMGYEETSFRVRGLTFPTGTTPAYITDDIRATLRGWAGHGEVGADWRVRPTALVGPYLQIMVGQYRVQDIRFGPPGLVPGNGGIPSTKAHVLVSLGVRGRYEL